MFGIFSHYDSIEIIKSFFLLLLYPFYLAFYFIWTFYILSKGNHFFYSSYFFTGIYSVVILYIPFLFFQIGLHSSKKYNNPFVANFLLILTPH